MSIWGIWGAVRSLIMKMSVGMLKLITFTIYIYYIILLNSGPLFITKQFVVTKSVCNTKLITDIMTKI